MGEGCEVEAEGRLLERAGRTVAGEVEAAIMRRQRRVLLEVTRTKEDECCFLIHFCHRRCELSFFPTTPSA